MFKHSLQRISNICEIIYIHIYIYQAKKIIKIRKERTKAESKGIKTEEAEKSKQGQRAASIPVYIFLVW